MRWRAERTSFVSLSAMQPRGPRPSSSCRAKRTCQRMACLLAACQLAKGRTRGNQSVPENILQGLMRSACHCLMQRGITGIFILHRARFDWERFDDVALYSTGQSSRAARQPIAERRNRGMPLRGRDHPQVWMRRVMRPTASICLSPAARDICSAEGCSGRCCNSVVLQWRTTKKCRPCLL